MARCPNENATSQKSGWYVFCCWNTGSLCERITFHYKRKELCNDKIEHYSLQSVINMPNLICRYIFPLDC